MKTDKSYTGLNLNFSAFNILHLVYIKRKEKKKKKKKEKKKKRKNIILFFLTGA